MTKIAPSATQADLVKMQFDYAWKWFAYHADQRTKMFNYMLVAMGIFATATVSSLDKGLPYVALTLCAVSTAFALSFSRLDKRNEELVRLGEEVLAHLERNSIFGEEQKIEDRQGEQIDFGILWRQKLIEDGFDQSGFKDALRGKHRFWLRTLSYILATIFTAAGIWIWVHLCDFGT